MQIKETSDVSFPSVVESVLLEDVVVLADQRRRRVWSTARIQCEGASVRDDLPAVSSRPVRGDTACRARRRDLRGTVPDRPTGERDRGRSAVRGPRHQQSFSCDQRRPAATSKPRATPHAERPSSARCRTRSREERRSAVSSSTLRAHSQNRSAGSSQAAGSQRWRTRWTRRCVLASRSAPT